MCSHYQVLKEMQRLRRHFGVDPRDLPELKDHAWKGYIAPFLRRADAAEYRRDLAVGQFQLIPDSGPLPKYSLFNARTEDVMTKRSFAGPWKRAQRCVIPAEWIIEPNYEENDKHVAWRIFRTDGLPLGIAGIYNTWQPKDGPPVGSFAMLTVNADQHPFMRRFHKTGDEKRSVVVLDPADYDRWLDCPVGAEAEFLRPPGNDELTGEPDKGKEPVQASLV